VEQFRVNWHGFILSRAEVDLDSVATGPASRAASSRYELAGRNTIKDYPAGRALLGVTDLDADWLEYEDRTAGVYRAVHVVNDRIDQCIFMSPRQDMPSRAWLASLFAKEQLSEIDRVGLLVGMPVEKGADTGPTVCSCGVGRNTICNAIIEKDLKTVPEVTACLKAGGNCGSCVPEIKKILVQTRVEAAEAQ
jgi:assimilatory nitrate reductase catalytic subunit